MIADHLSLSRRGHPGIRCARGAPEDGGDGYRADAPPAPDLWLCGRCGAEAAEDDLLLRDDPAGGMLRDCPECGLPTAIADYADELCARWVLRCEYLYGLCLSGGMVAWLDRDGGLAGVSGVLLGFLAVDRLTGRVCASDDIGRAEA